MFRPLYRPLYYICQYTTFMNLLPSQKNEIYDLIETENLSPNLFKFRDITLHNSSAVALGFNGTDYYFRIIGLDDGFSCEYSPGSEKLTENIALSYWKEVKRFMSLWLQYLNLQISQIDKWERLDQQIKQITIAQSDSAEKFSASEYEVLKERMLLLKSRLKEIEFTDEQHKALVAKIDHLTLLAISLNKFDWTSLFVGTIIGIVTQLTVNSENAKSLWDIIKTVFNSYFIIPN